jgi:hypothetical protein
MFNFILCFCPHTANHFAVLSQCTSDTQSIHIHLFGLVYFMSGVTHTFIWTSLYEFPELIIAAL